MSPAGWTPDCQCPYCGRTPNVGFSRGEVARAKRERQAARVMAVRCPRCHRGYWIHARDIAKAQPPGLFMLLDPKTATALRGSGVTTESQVQEHIERGTLGELQGVGPAREREIIEALDAAGQALVA